MTSIIKVDQIQNAAGVGGLTIDSGGIVTAEVKRNNIPYIQLLHNSDTLYSAGAIITNFRVHEANRITFSGGIITVPVDGLYQIGFSGITQGTGGVFIVKNGVRQFRIAFGSLGTGEAWSQLAGDCVMYLTAGSTINLDVENTINIFGTPDNTTVSSYYCYLIG